ncbi:MAG: 4-oxalocrotonate tautomerase [Chloroflexi bacterium]|nr:MAG: 4-oxalocrotonate tautomerase [Chloroflexota bacterium]
MLVLKVTMLEGRTPAQKSALINRLTQAAVRHLDADPDDVRVMIYEIPATNWGAGGVSLAEKQKQNT